MAIVEAYRTTSDANALLSIEYQLGMVAQLGIYSYFDHEFLERSKVFFVKTAQKIAKNEEIFNLIDESLRREVNLNKILKPSENTVSYLHKEYI